MFVRNTCEHVCICNIYVGWLEWFACLIFRGPLRWFQSAWEHQLCGKRLALWSLQFHYGKYAKYEWANTKMKNTKANTKMQNVKKTICEQKLVLRSLHLSNSIIAPHLDGERGNLMIESAAKTQQSPRLKNSKCSFKWSINSVGMHIACFGKDSSSCFTEIGKEWCIQALMPPWRKTYESIHLSHLESNL